MRRSSKFACAAALVFASSVSAAKVAVIAEALNGDVDPGSLEMVASAAEEAMIQAQGVTLISRRHLDKILAEQGLAYENVVNDRARLGQLAGAEILLVASITEYRSGVHRETISAYGYTENQAIPFSSAGISVKGLRVDTGEVVAQRQFSKKRDEGSDALELCVSEMKKSLVRLNVSSFVETKTQAPRHQVAIRPTSKGQDVQGLDLYVDGNFIGNTPITTDVEEGVREVALKQRDTTIWTNRVRITSSIWIKPELGDL
jgi:hypothetical protein